MRGYKISKDRIIEEVYDLAPEGSKGKYDGEPGIYTETAVNKLFSQNVRYKDFIELKANNRNLDLDLKDTKQELNRYVGEDKRNQGIINSLSDTLEENNTKTAVIKEELESIKEGIDSVLGGVR